MKKILAIDLGGNSAKCAIIDNQIITLKFEIPTPKDNILINLYEQITKKFSQNKVLWDDIKAISLSVPGAYDKSKGEIIYAGNLNWWNYPIFKEAKDIFNNQNVYILNDANAAVYGEWQKGQNGKPQSMMLYTLGTGIGHGIILNGQLWEGTNKYIASEGGHGGAFAGDDALCTCGVYGCLEVTSSATGIEKELNLLKNKQYVEKKLSCSFDYIKIVDIVDLFQNNDEIIVGIFNKSLLPLAKAIGYTQTILDLNKVVIGGGPSQLGNKIVNILLNNAKKYTTKVFWDSLNIEIAKLGNEAGVWGAYYWALDQLNTK